jgi:histidine triad (HIT) family protein
MKKYCLFCGSDTVKARTIVENKLAFAFPTNIPIVPGHTLICPKRHRETIDDLTLPEIKAIFTLQKKIKRALRKTFKAKGFNYAWNEGVAAGQNMSHFHLHMLPRKVGDEGVTKYEPRKFLYRPGSRKAIPEKELLAVAKLIKSKMLE